MGPRRLLAPARVGPLHPEPPGPRFRDHLPFAIRRVGLLFLAVFVVALVCSGTCLFVLRGTSITSDIVGARGVALELYLWTTLSVFAGVFVGLIAAGRKLGGS